MSRALHDHYFRQAKRDGYRSRAAYTLLEIDERRGVLRAGARVLDCGCAPGSWLQVAAKKVGARGIVVGVDRNRTLPLPETGFVHVLEADLREVPAAELLVPLIEKDGPDARFDVVLSDMAPDTTGERSIDHHQSVRLCQAVLGRCRDVLAPGGNLVMKVFEGEAYPDLLTETAVAFDTVKGFRPKASRAISREMYVIARGFHPDALPEPEASPVPRRPPAGWQ